jgi:hypothetical protein
VEQRPGIPSTDKQVTAPSARQILWPTNPSVAQILKQMDPVKATQRQEAIGKAMEARNVPLDFYGQTIDQDGNPLPGVQIGIMIRHWTVSLEGTSVRANRTSDASGYFDVHDVTGDAFDLEGMSKEGYELEPTHRGWGPTGGAPGNPVIFKLWRNDIKEPLITGQKSLPIEPNGTPYVIDFSKGAILQSDGEGGDLILRIDMPPAIDGKYPDWSCEFRTVNGGLTEETDTSSAMFLAPTTGYSNLFSFFESATNPWNRQSGTLRLFLRLKDGKEYGRVSIDMAGCARKPDILRVEYAINPTGSRILR